jgi:glycosyltransferase involved in cell wall biosynthesis
MKILFFISTPKQGKASGGHYHSLDQISRELAKVHEVNLISIGGVESPVIKNNPYFLRHIPLKRNVSAIFSFHSILKKIIEGFKPDIVHCFDADSLNRLLVQTSIGKIPLVMNKCGGMNPLGSDYQHADGIVTFSAENYEWYKSNKNYRKELIVLIPNRVKKLELLPERERREAKAKGKTTFIRISRLGGAYEHTLRSTYNLIEELITFGYSVELIVIGRIQDEGRFEILREEVLRRNLPVRFITDERASKASDFLYLADFAIGTGRSFMEAISLGIPTLAPALNAQKPILVNKSNIQNFFFKNFSERTIVPENHIKNSERELITAIQNKKKYDDLCEEAKELFIEYFGTDKILYKYNDFYMNAIQFKYNRIRLILLNLNYLIKFYMI